MPDEGRHSFGQGEVTRGVGGVFQRRNCLLLGLFFVESVVGDDPEMEIRAEGLGHRGVEFHLGGGVLPGAFHFGHGRLSGVHGEGFLAFVEPLGERGGNDLPGLDRDAVFPGDELQLLHIGLGGVFADQFAARIVDARYQMVLRVVLPVGLGACGRNIHFEHARARCGIPVGRLPGTGSDSECRAEQQGGVCDMPFHGVQALFDVRAGDERRVGGSPSLSALPCR